MRGAAPRSAQRGVFTPAMGLIAIAMAAFAVGGVGLGRLVAVKADCQRAADAAALAAAQNIRGRGLPYDAGSRASAEAVGRRNSQLPIAFTWTVTDKDDAVEVAVEARIQVELPALVWLSGTTDVTARSKTSVKQTKFDEVTRRLPKLAMVLDYSGSMDLGFSGGGGSAISVLEQSVRSLLAANLRIDYGAVFYSSNVFQTVAIGPGAPAQINNIMDSYGAGGTTNTGAGLNAARNILAAAEDTGRYVLLVSDGEPCCNSSSASQARGAATAIWDMAPEGATIFTLEIRRSGSSAAMDQFMTDVAGEPTNRGDRNFHFVATSAADLLDTFEDIVARIICAAGPLDPVPEDPETLHVFLTGGGGERPVPATGDLVADRDLERFQYDAGTQKIHLTEAACDAVMENGDDIIIRFDAPSLIE